MEKEGIKIKNKKHGPELSPVCCWDKNVLIKAKIKKTEIDFVFFIIRFVIISGEWEWMSEETQNDKENNTKNSSEIKLSGRARPWLRRHVETKDSQTPTCEKNF